MQTTREDTVKFTNRVTQRKEQRKLLWGLKVLMLGERKSTSNQAFAFKCRKLSDCVQMSSDQCRRRISSQTQDMLSRRKRQKLSGNKNIK